MQRCCQQILVAAGDADLRPVLFRTIVIYVCYAFTVVKCIFANRRYALRDGHLRQSDAVGKRAATNGSHAVRYLYGRQCGTTTECIAADAGHTIRNCHGRQAAAVPERMVADAGHALLHDDALDVRPAAVPR